MFSLYFVPLGSGLPVQITSSSDPDHYTPDLGLHFRAGAAKRRLSHLGTFLLLPQVVKDGENYTESVACKSGSVHSLLLEPNPSLNATWPRTYMIQIFLKRVHQHPWHGWVCGSMGEKDRAPCVCPMCPPWCVMFQPTPSPPSKHHSNIRQICREWPLSGLLPLPPTSDQQVTPCGQQGSLYRNIALYFSALHYVELKGQSCFVCMGKLRDGLVHWAPGESHRKGSGQGIIC